MAGGRWDPASGRVIGRLRKQVGWSRALAENGAVLADSGAVGAVRLTDPRGARVLRSIRTGINPIWDLAWSPDGSTLASAGSDGRFRLFGVPRA
jgi:WD40 repeat protein